MKTIILFLVFLASTTLSFAQKKDKREGSYSIQLVAVDAPKIIQSGIVDSLTSTFEDSIVKISWQYAISQIGFELTNKCNETIKIVWDDAAFISIENESGRIFHKGIKYIDRENPQAPTSIYKNTTLSDLIAPTNNVYYVCLLYTSDAADE